MGNPNLEGGYASPYSIFETTTFDNVGDAGHRVGTRGVLDDRVFRWAKFNDSTAIGPNKVAAGMAPVTNHTTQTTGAFVAGDTSISITLGATAAAQNHYRGGYLKVQDATLGIGQIFKLRPHDFVAASGTLTASLVDPVTTTTSGTEIVSLVANPWSGVVIGPTTAVTGYVGVTMANFAVAATASVVTAGYEQTGTATWTQPRYGWVQTWGLASVLQDTSNIVAGSSVIYGAVAGTVGLAIESDVKQRIGIAWEALATDSKYASVYLQIAP